MDKSEIPAQIKVAIEMTEILSKCKTVEEALNILSNVTMNFFVLNTKPWCTLAALKNYFIDLKEKVVTAEEVGIKSLIENIKHISQDELKTLFESLKKDAKDSHVDTSKKDNSDFRNN